MVMREKVFDRVQSLSPISVGEIISLGQLPHRNRLCFPRLYRTVRSGGFAPFFAQTKKGNKEAAIYYLSYYAD